MFIKAQEVRFSRKTGKINHPKVRLGNTPVARTFFQKNFGLHLDGKLNFNKHIHEKITKTNKEIGIFRRIFNILLRIITIFTIYLLLQYINHL